jgi:hypothetical protein
VGTFERRESNSTNEESSINRQNSHSPSPNELRLQHGGLIGLQNLGNTVILFF